MRISANRNTNTKKTSRFFLIPLTILTAFVATILLIYHHSVAQSEQIVQGQTKEVAAFAVQAQKNAPVLVRIPGVEPIKAILEDYTQSSSIWMLVNKTQPVSLDYIPANLVIPPVALREDKSDEEKSVRSDIVEPLKDMFATAKSEKGYELLIGSGYRSAELQNVYFSSSAAISGETQANKYLAYPGQSEHQTGLTVDIATVSRYCYVDTCFTDTLEGQWLAANAHRFGFILRYPSDKTAITGYSFEPWHFRYVGKDLAAALYESGLTLDEAWPYLNEALTKLKEKGVL